MKRLILAAVLLVVAAPAFAVKRTVVMVDEVIRMSKAGVGDDEIISYIRKHDQAFDVTGDDVIAMTEAKVSKAVIKEVIDESAARMSRDRSIDREDRSDRRRVYIGVGIGGWGWYDPYWYPRPRVFFSVGSRWGWGYGYYPRYGRFYRGWHRR